MNSINRIVPLALGTAVSMNEYQNVATQFAVYPGQGTWFGLNYCILKLNGEAGEAAEHLGKAMRDDGLALAPLRETSHIALLPERKTLIVKELGDTLWYIAAAAKELGLTLEEVARINIGKLASREKQGTLQGSGDNR